jgi:hypothetical protein
MQDRDVTTDSSTFDHAGAFAGEGIQPERSPNAGGEVNAELVSEPRLKRAINNKRRTGGPNTEQGKAVAAANALKHGVYAEKFFSQDDDYYEIERAMRVELAPTGVVEDVLTTIAARKLHSWDQLQRITNRRLEVSQRSSVDSVALARRLNFPWAQTHHELLTSETNWFVLLRRIQFNWTRLAKPPKPKNSDELMSASDSRVAVVYKDAMRMFAKPALNEFVDFEFFEQMDEVMREARQGQNYLGKRCNGSPDDVGLLVDYWILRHRNEISMLTHDARDERTLAIHTDPNISRAEMNLSRSLKNAMTSLAEHRRLVDARLGIEPAVPAGRSRR